MALTDNISSRLQSNELRTRILVAMWLLGVAFVSLVSRLYTLQILRGEELSSKGRRNFVQQVNIAHDRGIIYDRYGRILADNRPSLDLQVIPAFLGKRKKALQTLNHLGELVQMPPEELGRAVELVTSRVGLERFRPLIIRRDLDAEQVEAVEDERSVFMLDGVDIVEGRRRNYHFGSLAAHVLGYVNEIDSATLEAERTRGNPNRYDLGDVIGREGIERSYERDLRGIDGIEKVVVDAKGRRQQTTYVDLLLGEQRRIDPVPGHNVFLTIDLDLQQVAENTFKTLGQAGSVVALDVKTGAVLVLASLPAYDANLVSGSIAKQFKDKLDRDPLKPWLNRSIQGQYAPGSTFKAVTALAALEDEALGPADHVYCPGFFRLGRHVWRCWKDSGHGSLDLRTALKVSCDTFFYTMGNRSGIDAIARMARTLSLGTRTGIALRGEQPGIVPDEAFHNRVDASTGGYQKGMAINTSIGQGSLLVTPLQLAVAYGAVAHGKQVFKPQLVDAIETADFRVTRRFLPEPLAQQEADVNALPQWLANPNQSAPTARTEVHGDEPTRIMHLQPIASANLDLPDASMAQLRAGLEAVTTEPGGTGYASRSRKVSMAGKTGTAQVVRLGRERLKQWQIDYFERDHAWFVAYAPSDDPQIVIAVINEHAGHGGSAAAPIAVAVIDTYFQLKKNREITAPPIKAVEINSALNPDGIP